MAVSFQSCRYITSTFGNQGVDFRGDTFNLGRVLAVDTFLSIINVRCAFNFDSLVGTQNSDSESYKLGEVCSSLDNNFFLAHESTFVRVTFVSELKKVTTSLLIISKKH